jgi:sulfur-oxidizing protein SoxZ
MARALINVARRARIGEIIEVRLLISHPMESGQRRGPTGAAYPRDIIHSLRATFNGALVLELDLYPAIAANPFFAFTLQAERSGTLLLTWIDDHGAIQTERAEIEVA